MDNSNSPASVMAFPLASKYFKSAAVNSKVNTLLSPGAKLILGTYSMLKKPKILSYVSEIQVN